MNSAKKETKNADGILLRTEAFDMPTTAAHCVWLEGEDFDILKESDVTVACCPISNFKLGSGFCNVPKLISEGVKIALGTDSAASNNNLNLFEEMKGFVQCIMPPMTMC